MSVTYDSDTFFVENEPTPKSFASAEQLRALVSAAWSRATPDPAEIYLRDPQARGALTYVSGTTRNGWAVSTMTKLLERSPLPALQFLTFGGDPQVFAGEYSELRVSVLGGEKQAGAIAGLRDLLGRLGRTPESLTQASGGVCSDPGVLEAAQSDTVSRKPAYDLHVGGEDGEGADYQLVWLRSILAVLENAAQRGVPAVHVMDCPM